MSVTVGNSWARPIWDRGYTGKGVLVAHLDTGIDGDHPALRGKLASFRLYNDDGTLSASRKPLDTGYHGTHLAGIICGSGEKAIGIAPDAKLLSAAVINGGQNLLRILAGMDWVLRTKARILLLPFGTTSPNPALFSMIQALRSAGVLVISPIGNGGPRRSTAPGIYSNVLSVGAVDHHSRVASFSGSLTRKGICLSPDILAPGVDVLSADAAASGFKSRSGTSQAAALVAGLAALLLQARPDTAVDQLEYALAAGCDGLEAENGRRSRFGCVNPLLALNTLLEAPPEACIEPLLLPETARYVDPAVRRSTTQTRVESQPCVFVTAEHVPSKPEQPAPEIIVAHIEQLTGEKSHQLRTFADGRTAAVSASSRFLRSLIDSDMVLVASAPRITTNPFA